MPTVKNRKSPGFVPLKDGRPRAPEVEVMDWTRGELRTAVLCGCGLNQTGWCNCGAFTPPHLGGRAPDGYVWKDWNTPGAAHTPIRHAGPA